MLFDEIIETEKKRKYDVSHKDEWVQGLGYWVHRVFSYPQTGLYSVYLDAGETNGELIRILDYKDGIRHMNVIYDTQYPDMVDKNL